MLRAACTAQSTEATVELKKELSISSLQSVATLIILFSFFLFFYYFFITYDDQIISSPLVWFILNM